MLEVGQKIEGKVETIAFGGNGIIRHQGFVVFVPFTAPEDVIIAKLTSVKKTHAFAVIEKIIQPSTKRIQPKCPYFGWCGGCQLQHLDYSAQMESKRQAVLDALKRIGLVEENIPFESIPANPQWHYRRHITLNLRPTEKSYEYGYFAVDNTSLIPIEVCPIFLEGRDLIFEQLRAVILSLKTNLHNEGKVVVMKSENGFIVDFRFKKNFPLNCQGVLEKAKKDWPNWKGIVATAPGKKLAYGDLSVTFTIENLVLKCSTSAFVQSNLEQAKNLYEKTLRIIEESKSKTLLDLYCGIGITSLLAKKHGVNVVGVEFSSEAIKLAKINAIQNKIEGIDWFCDKVENILHKLLRQYKADCVLINPPRAGIHEKVVEALLKEPPKTLIYISCMPSTLARDVQRLNGVYKPIKGSVFDMFPQTYHLETLLHLERKD